MEVIRARIFFPELLILSSEINNSSNFWDDRILKSCTQLCISSDYVVLMPVSVAVSSVLRWNRRKTLQRLELNSWASQRHQFLIHLSKLLSYFSREFCLIWRIFFNSVGPETYAVLNITDSCIHGKRPHVALDDSDCGNGVRQGCSKHGGKQFLVVT
jgi:hypothetical protein